MLRVLLLLLCSVGIGCGGTITVSGDVTYDGVPVENGRIDFIPVDGKGTSASGSIKAGKYKVTSAAAGERIVQITAVNDVAVPRSNEDLAKEWEAYRAKGMEPPNESADRIPPNAVGNNQTVEVRTGVQEYHFHLRKPAKN